jgi:4-hydroxy-3-polyprenylbenzoate decarboxylase
MGYRDLAACVADLQKCGRLVVIEQEIDPRLEIAAIQRRVYEAQGPALLFRRVKGCRFPVVSNLFGTLDRARYLFRDTLDEVRLLVDAKIDPKLVLTKPRKWLRLARCALHLAPKRVRRGPILEFQTTVNQLPQVVSWPRDGGAFVTLPAVYTEDPERPGFRHSNLGMYRVQLSGNNYLINEEVGLHYQIHRGIGVHHTSAVRRGEPLRVNVIVGGPPSLLLAAVMPLPEGLPELSFAGALAGRRLSMVLPSDGLAMPAEADFVIEGVVDPHQTKPEGPFGDHLGYYSLTHDFPVLKVKRVWHRANAIWPITCVGRPPQEDTTFGDLIHELTGPLIPQVLPGVKAVNAVDAAGVHPLLLAIGSERYVPFEARCRPMELLTQANAILGQGQMSLAKYLLIVAQQDAPDLDVNNLQGFFQHALERVDWKNDLHFQTRTTIDTLDYSGHGLNQGSKVVIAAVGQRKRELARQLNPSMSLPRGFSQPKLVMPGVLAVNAPAASADRTSGPTSLRQFCQAAHALSPYEGIPLVTLVDDSEFAARNLQNWLWVTFTRSNPAADIDGIGAFSEDKHWGCLGPLVIDARIKPHHAPPLDDDPQVSRGIDLLAAPGGPLHGIF